MQEMIPYSRQIGIITILIMGLFSLASHAEQQPSSIAEVVIVQPNCNVVGGNVTLSFGNYDPSMANLTQDLNGASNFSIRCTPGTAAEITMDNGQHASGPMRRMVNGLGNFLEYQIYTDSGRTMVWNTSNKLSYAANTLQPKNFSVYGRVPAGQQSVQAGNYADVVTILITF